MQIDEILKFMQDTYGTIKIVTKGSYGNEDISAENIRSLNKGGPCDLTYCSMQGDAAEKAIIESKAGFIVCDYALCNEPPLLELELPSSDRKVMIFVEKPRLWFARMLREFEFADDLPAIEENGSFSDSRTMFKAPYKIGKGCIIDPFVAIGLPGFGYVRNEYGQLEHFPHMGGVKIGDYVEIGASSAVDKGVFSDSWTVIGNGCKIDNLVHIAHNVTIGSNCTIVSHCNIGGSCTIGDQSYLGMSVVVNDHVKIGKRVAVGSGSLVTKDLPDNTIAWGHPIDHRFSVDLKPQWASLVGP